MHELGIAEKALEIIREKSEPYPNMRVVRAGLRIGELAGVDVSALQFAFDAILPGTDYEGMKVEVEFVSRGHRCTECGAEFVVRDYDAACPNCHSVLTTCIAGEELDLTYVEVEEYAKN